LVSGKEMLNGAPYAEACVPAGCVQFSAQPFQAAFRFKQTVYDEYSRGVGINPGIFKDFADNVS